MWYGFPKTLSNDPKYVLSAKDLLNTTFRNIVFVTGGAYLAWQAMAVNNLTYAPVEKVTLLSILVAATWIAVLFLISRLPLLARVIWQVALVSFIMLALFLFQQPQIAFLFILLPLMSTVTLGWLGGLLQESVVIGIMIFASQQPWMSVTFKSLNLVVIFGGAFAGFLGWAATNTLLESNHSFFSSYEKVLDQLEDVRAHQLDLKQTEEDLVLANRELARMSKELKLLYQVAEEARQAKEKFVANVSHELRTPLNMIIGFSEMIPKSSQVYGIQLPQALLADIAAIRRNSQHLSKLVDDVLDLGQIEAGRMALSKEWTSVLDVIEESKVAMRALYESKKLYLETDVEPELPRVFWDSTRIRQVVLNLLSNAGRFTKQGGVRVKAWRDKEDIIISITDTGLGIAPDDLKRLFEPFQQLDVSIHRQYGGSGLGLSISKEFIEMHGGRMWLKSEIRMGTTFFFSLPIGIEIPSDITANHNSQRWFRSNENKEYRIRSRKSKAPVSEVLPRYVVLERGKTLQHLLTRYFHGVDIVSVGTSKEAEIELSRSPARALILNKPPSDESLYSNDLLKKIPFRTPAITCWFPGEDEAAQKLGARRYLIKPISLDNLISILNGLESDVKDILLIDDNQEELQLLSRMLASTNRGYSILQAASGKRGLDLMRQRHPDVVLLDLIMPGMDGFQVLHEINQDSLIRKIPVIIVSSNSPTGDPIISDELILTRGGGFSVREILACLEAFSEILFHEIPPSALTNPAGQAPPGIPAE